MTSIEIIDFHAHVLHADLPDFAEELGDARWPRVVPLDHTDRGEVRCGETVFRAVRRALWDRSARLSAMDQHGIDAQVVSPMPIAITYWASADDALRFAREQNDRIAADVAGGKGRLLGLGTVPLQDPAAAIVEMRRAVDDLGLSGLEIGTVVDGAELDHPDLRPFFRAAAERSVPLFVHPIDGAGATRCSNPLLDFGIGMHTDTSLAAYALVYRGVLAELPDLRICLSHGGGGFPWTHPRLRLLDPTPNEQLDNLVRRLWVDTLVFDPAHLPLLARRYGVDHLVLGTDDPFIPMALHDPRAVLDDASTQGLLTTEDVGRIKGANARTFLGD